MRLQNFLVLGPVVIQPLFNVSTTSLISSSVISGGENGISIVLISQIFHILKYMITSFNFKSKAIEKISQLHFPENTKHPEYTLLYRFLKSSLIIISYIQATCQYADGLIPDTFNYYTIILLKNNTFQQSLKLFSYRSCFSPANTLSESYISPLP